MNTFRRIIWSIFASIAKNSLDNQLHFRSLVIWAVVEVYFMISDLIVLIANRENISPSNWKWFVLDSSLCVYIIIVIRILKALPYLREVIGVIVFFSYTILLEAYIALESDTLIITTVFSIWIYTIILYNDFVRTTLLALLLHTLFYLYVMYIFIYRMPNDLQNVKQELLLKVTTYGYFILIMPIHYIMELRYKNLLALLENKQLLRNWVKVMQYVEIGIFIENIGHESYFKNRFYKQMESQMKEILHEYINSVSLPCTIEYRSMKYRLNKASLVFMGKQCNIYFLNNVTTIAKEEEEKHLQLLIATITHELRTPLNIIMAIFNQLLEDASSTSKDAIKKGLVSAELQESLINDILDVSKINYGHLIINKSATDIFPLFNDIFELFKFRISDKIEFTFDALKLSHNYVLVDGRRVKQIVCNLLSNSVKFTKLGHIKMQVQLKKSKLICSIIDSGVGISPNDQLKIFTQFGKGTTQAKMNPNGTGLGLNLCKKLCNAMGGDIEFNSVPYVQTCFTFWVPVEATQLLTTSKDFVSVCQTVEPSNGILNIDDDALNIYIMNNYATKAHVKCYSFSHSLEAIEALETNNLEVHLAFIDLNMPEMNGYETAKKIRQICQSMVLIAVTGNDKDMVENQCKIAGFNEILEKPLTYEKYHQFIRMYLGN